MALYTRLLNKKEGQNYIFWDEKMENFTKKITDKSVYYEPVDENNRRYPCCKYIYDKNGFNEEDFIEK